MSTAPASNADAFAFIQQLASELSTGKVDLPSFPEVALRVRKVLADEKTSLDQIVRIVGSEPALATNLLNMANSAAFSRGKPVSDLRNAINRLGHNMVKSAAMAFAMRQMQQAPGLVHVAGHLKELWKQSTHVSALAYVLTKRFSQRNADESLLAGLLHNIGKLYILTRIVKHPALYQEKGALEELLRTWHASIGKAILENWELPEEVVLAVSEHEDITRDHRGTPDLTDLVTVAVMMAAYVDHPEDLELNMQGIKAFHRMGLDGPKAQLVMQETTAEIEALRQALGS